MRRTVLLRLQQIAVVAMHAVVYAVLWLALWIAIPVLVFQWSPVVLTGDSMQPGLGAGDVILMSPHSGEDLGPGTVIVFEDPNANGLTTHRIVGVDEDGRYRTKGDGNGVADSTLVAPQSVRGIGRLAVPSIGLLRVWLETRDIVALGAFTAVSLAILVGCFVPWSRRRRTVETLAIASSEAPAFAATTAPAFASGEAPVSVLGASVASPNIGWAGVRELLRLNRRRRPLAALAALGAGARTAMWLVESGNESDGEIGPLSPRVASEHPARHLRTSGIAWLRVMDKAAVVLFVVGAITLVLIMSPVRMAATRFVGTTGSGGSSITTDTLNPPTGVGAGTSTVGQVNLTWTPTVDLYATGYHIYRSETSGSGYSFVNTVVGRASASYSDVFTPTKRTYFYVIKAYYGAWTSAYSGQATANVGYHGIIKATSGLVSYWRLGLSTTISVAPDDWGPSNGTPAGGFTPGQAGAIVGDSDTAAGFNGTSGTVNVGNHVSLQLSSGSVEAWAIISGTSSGYREIVSKESVYYLATKDNILGVFDDGSNTWRSSGVAINNGAWHHIVMTYQSGVVNGTKIYLDGTLVLTTTITQVAQTKPVFIGSFKGTSEFWAGRIDEVAIYNTVLSSTVISQHRQAGITP